MTELIKENLQHRKLPLSRIIIRIIAITIGAILMATGLEIFLVPNNVIDGALQVSLLCWRILLDGNWDSFYLY